MLNISIPACTKVELWDLTVCIVVNGEKFPSSAVTLTFIRRSSISNSSEIFSYNYNIFQFRVPRSISFWVIVQARELWCMIELSTCSILKMDLKLMDNNA